MDEKILAYRSELQKRSENTPFWTRTILTVEEAAAYTGIGRAKIRHDKNSDYNINYTKIPPVSKRREFYSDVNTYCTDRNTK